MLEGLILGIIQGITEWLPISSEGILTLVGLKLFNKDFAESVSMAMFLHLGTFLAALVYFRKDVLGIFKKEFRRLLFFLISSTLITGLVAVPLLLFVSAHFSGLSVSFVVVFVGMLLVVTGVFQIKKPGQTFRTINDLRIKDGIVAGIWQGLSSLPGLSRSGLTIACLLLRKFQKGQALKLSFLMSLPAVLAGNIFFNLSGKGIDINVISLAALMVSFAVGFLTIGFLLKISRKINFGWFTVLFGLLTLSVLIL